MAHTTINQPTSEWFATTGFMPLGQKIMVDAGTYLILPLLSPVLEVSPGVLARWESANKENGWAGEGKRALPLSRRGEGSVWLEPLPDPPNDVGLGGQRNITPGA